MRNFLNKWHMDKRQNACQPEGSVPDDVKKFMEEIGYLH